MCPRLVNAHAVSVPADWARSYRWKFISKRQIPSAEWLGVW